LDTKAYETFARNEKNHFWFRGRRAVFFDLIRRHIAPNLPEKPTCFDLGCGVGGMLESMSEFGRGVGMDIDPDSLAFCKERGFGQVFEGRGHRLPLQSDSIDMIGAFDVLEHIPEEAETIAECYRILKPGGFLFLSGPAYQFLYTHQDKMVHHERRYTTSGLKQKFSDAGFEIVRSSYINFLLFPLILPAVLWKKFREAIKPPAEEETRFNTDVYLPGILNSLFSWLFSAERYILRYISVPTGHSLVLVVRKPQVQ
jgi:SAM-dependent methyltransferase